MRRSAAWLREQAAQAIDKTLGVSNGELLLESMLWPGEVAQEAHNSASTFKTTGDVAGALRHAPACSITSTPVSECRRGECCAWLAHMPATHDTLYEDTYRKAGRQYESSTEDSGISDCSSDSASDGRVSPGTNGELLTRRLPGRPLTRGPSVESSAGKKRPKRRTKPRVSPADTGGRDADLVSADIPTDPVAKIGLSAKSADAPTGLPTKVGLSAKSADTPVACLCQVGMSTTSADTLLAVQAAPGDTPAPLEGMPGTPEEVAAAAAHAGAAVAVTSSGGVADTPDDGADSQEDGQVDFGLPLSALQAGIEEEDQLKEDAATTTGRRAAPSSRCPHWVDGG
jgi:hypothetical protein